MSDNHSLLLRVARFFMHAQKVNNRIGVFFLFNDAATADIYTLSLHDALPISPCPTLPRERRSGSPRSCAPRSEEHTSELQSQSNLVCRLLLEKKNIAAVWYVNTLLPRRSRTAHCSDRCPDR